MIVNMKKIAVIAQSKTAELIVRNLRYLGVVHLEHQQPPSSPRLSAVEDDLLLVNEAIDILSLKEFETKSSISLNKELSDWRLISKHIIDLYKRLDHLEQFSCVLINKIAYWRQWGDFDPAKIEDLSRKDIFIRFYRIPEKEIVKLPPDIIVKKIVVSGGIASCVIVSRLIDDIGYKPIHPPQMGLNDMRLRLAEDQRVIQLVKEDILKAKCYYDDLLSKKKALLKEKEFYEALGGMGRSAELIYLSGYVPYDKAEILLETSRKQRWAVSIKEPSCEDMVPTLVRNPAWISIIKPVFKIIEVFPGYREVDISMVFLIFLSIFFGILIGDAGYGLFLGIMTLFAHKKWGRRIKDRSIFALMYLFSICTVVWGALSATFFGQQWLPQAVKPLVPALRDERSLQSICFFIGAIHLTVGHIWRAIVYLPSLIALSELGWIFILWGAFFLAKTLIIGAVFPAIAKWLLMGGGLLIVFFSSPSRNFLKGIGAGMGNLLLNAVNSFTDIVSYIRLFAVGLATVAVADAFNKMAMEAGFAGFPAIIIAVFILLLGHILNIVLGPMAILVHGVRLNVLEFCNHINVKWSGFPYKPLKE